MPPDPSSVELTFDVSDVTARRARQTVPSPLRAYLLRACFIFVGGLIVFEAIFAPSASWYIRALAPFVAAFAFYLAYTVVPTSRRQRLLTPTYVVVSALGISRRREGSPPRTMTWTNLWLGLRIKDYRGLSDGESGGAAGFLMGFNDSWPLTGPAIDGILGAARAQHLEVTQSSEPVATRWGSLRGQALVWRIRRPRTN